ncbi:hypothetical protein FB480_103451 [Agrobacterium vitis]|nr:hypothetical protein FB480_103451 [Agrobacterium vitis]
MDVKITRHPSYATLDVRLPDGSPLPAKGAVVDISEKPYCDLVSRGLVVVDAESLAAATKAADAAGDGANGGAS